MEVNKMNKYTMYNKEMLLNHKLCVCMDCLSEYDVSKVLDWIDDGATAFCPYCWNDAVVVSTKHTSLYTEEDIYGYFERDPNINPPRGYTTITYREDDGCELPKYETN